MSASITPIKPNHYFPDTCGIPMGSNPRIVEAVRRMCESLAIPTEAVQTESQFMQAFCAMCPPTNNFDLGLANLRRAMRIHALLILAHREGPNDLATLALCRSLEKLANGERLPPQEMEQVCRLMRQQGLPVA